MEGIRYMRSYEIVDTEEHRSVGILLYYEKKKDFIIELQCDLDEWTAPLLFTNLVRNGVYTVPRDLSFLWVKERVIPSGRQNISAILKNHKMDAYDEMKFLELSKARCSQDNLCIKKIDRLPAYVVERAEKHVVDCVPCAEHKVLCFFADGTVKKIDLLEIQSVTGVDKVLRNEPLYQSCQVGTGGYSITFDDSIDIPAWILYDVGVTIPLSQDDFICFAKNNLLDTTECCEVLDCSRQNISYMVKRGQLEEVKANVKGNLYQKGDVLKNMW